MFVLKPEQLVGQQVKSYRLTKFLSGGGFGYVYQAEHVKLNKKVAIKLLKPEHVLNKKHLAAFEREAKIIASLTHPHILDIYDYDVFDEIPFIVMPFIEQGSLRTLHPCHSILDMATILTYVRQIASALHYAHDHKIVHRDVKPDNFLRGPQGVLLSDFGIAITAHSINSLTPQDGIGTLVYMASEQYDGQAQVWSDQYSLAVVIYEWLCGKVPFTVTTLYELYRKHKGEAPPSFKQQGVDVPQAVEQVVRNGLAKRPEERYPSISAFAEALERAFLEHQATMRSSPIRDQVSEIQLALKPETSPVAIQANQQPEHAASPKPTVILPYPQQSQPIVFSEPKPSSTVDLGASPKQAVPPDAVVSPQPTYNDNKISSSQPWAPRLISKLEGGGVQGYRGKLAQKQPPKIDLQPPQSIPPAQPTSQEQRDYHPNPPPTFILPSQPESLGQVQPGAPEQPVSPLPNPNTTATHISHPAYQTSPPNNFSQVQPVERVNPSYQVRSKYPGNIPFSQPHNPNVQPIQHNPTVSRRRFFRKVGAAALAVAGVTGAIGAVEWAINSRPISTINIQEPSPVATHQRTAPVQPKKPGTVLEKYNFDSYVTSVAWSPDGKYIAAASDDVQVWEAFTGNPFAPYVYTNEFDPSSLSTSVAWSPDGKYIAQGDDSGYILVWERYPAN